MHQKLILVAILLCIGCTPKPPARVIYINLGDTYEVKAGQIVAFSTLDEAFEQYKFVEDHIQPGQYHNDAALHPNVRADLEARIKSNEAKLYLPNDKFALKSKGKRALAGRLVEFYELDSGFWLYEDDLSHEMSLNGVTRVGVLNPQNGNSP